MSTLEASQVEHLASFSFRLNIHRYRTQTLENLGVKVTGDLVEVHNGSVVCDRDGTIINFRAENGGAFFFNPYDKNSVRELKIHTTHNTGIKMPLNS